MHNNTPTGETPKQDPVYTVKTITAQETYPVRHPVLRAGKPIETCVFAGDDAADTFHLGLFSGEQLVGVSTFMKNEHQDFTGNQLQLRGMAILAEFQKKGLGAILVEHALAIAKEKNYETLWCNAREIAVPFYKRQGFAIHGEEFDIPGIGPHFVMHIKINA